MVEETPTVTELPNWIKALGGLILAAALANGAMVWFSLSGHRDLVRSDYYQAGLQQDARMARRALADGYRIELTAVPGGWSVRAEPAKGPVAGSTCRVRFIRPDDGRRDRTASLQWVEDRGRWEGPSDPIGPGRWDILIEWDKDGKTIMESAFARDLHE